MKLIRINLKLSQIYLHPTSCIWGAAPLFAHKYTFTFSKEYSLPLSPDKISYFSFLIFSLIFGHVSIQYYDKTMFSGHVGVSLT